jgi:hypothetical protein
MARANQIQDNPAIDVANDFARCALNSFWIDYLHSGWYVKP